jgi:type II restriction enzyme
LETLADSFEENSNKIIEELRAEIKSETIEALIDHLRFCGAVPEQYGHDSTQEKLYSKYTDSVVSESFSSIGLISVVVGSRANSADVQARGDEFSLVADAKAFRLSRTAKNQKDFKIQALDGWRNGLDYAVLVCPIYQLPTRQSQIYYQAIARNVCIISYSHLSTLVALALRQGVKQAESAFHDILKTVPILHPGRNAVDYWMGVNQSLVKSLDKDADIWITEKRVSIESLESVKQESLGFLMAERNRLLALSHQEALEALIRSSRIDSRAAQVRSIEHGELLGAESSD